MINIVTIDKQFIDIPSYEGLYKMSRDGIVLKNGRLKPMSQHLSTNGYINVRLSKGGKTKTEGLHRLIALSFIDNPRNLPVVNHKDLNKLNNSIDNIEWCTQKYNLEHSVSLGNTKPLSGKGEKNGFSKLKKEQVLQIREAYKNNKLSQREIGEIYGVKQTTVANIITRTNWKHI